MTKNKQPDAQAIAEARKNPGGWVYVVDHPYGLNEYVPPEAIEGAWQVDEHGSISGDFHPSPNYRPIERSSRRLPQYMHSVARQSANEWLSEIDPRCESLFPNVPEVAIVGFWQVDADGSLSNRFRPSSRYDPDAVKVLMASKF